MIGLRTARVVRGPRTGVPDAAALIPEWTARARCIDDVALFAGEPSPSLDSPVELLRRLVCDRCSVRAPCARESLQTRTVASVDVWDRYRGAVRRAEPVTLRASGVWAGSGDDDRRAVEGMEIDDAVAALEAARPDRLRIRIAAWTRSLPTRRTLRVVDARIAEIVGVDLPGAARLTACPTCRVRQAEPDGSCRPCRDAAPRATSRSGLAPDPVTVPVEPVLVVTDDLDVAADAGA